MSNLFIADTHLGHANIIRHSNRPFSNVDVMDTTIIRNWVDVASPSDDVYAAGDLIFRAADPEKYLKQLTGHIHLIKGNHDTYLKDKRLWKYFESIDNYLEIREGNTKIILFHYPICEWDGYFSKNPVVHLYGHIHNNEYEISKQMDAKKNCYNIGADILDFTPRTLAEIKEIYKKKGIK